MKSFYFTFLAMLLVMAVRPMQAQTFSPELLTPTIRYQKANEPFIGVGVGIPIRKLFGTKKTMMLPKPSKFVTNESVRSIPVTPSSTITSNKNSKGTNVPVNSRDENTRDRRLNDKVPVLDDDNPSKGVATNQCYDVWLTTFYSDGTSDERLMYTFCVSDQPPTKDRNGPSGPGRGDTDSKSKMERLLEEIETNDCERRYARLHPWIIPLMYLNRAQNDSWCRQKYPEAATQGESSPNSMRHALFQAQNFCTIGESATRDMSQRHEVCDNVVQGPSQAASDMDTFNNEAGIGIGRELQSLGLCDNFVAMATFIEEAYFNGRLRRIDGQPTP
ncbi:DUF6973 domain-containing protein [Fibrella aquatilis]|uniref:DUF6973 domain-containing protein n=1 Tax=Fibrella aquatilis TaxID=2817059 RepID=A0A939G2I8_9BACT|nr:hypothetical protein [Fibrella aquatilis]MBO0929983.1 hypothetical protein [Fibrella aquatilis]